MDLDGAFSGKPGNLEIVENIIKGTDLTVQMGGGIRDISSLKRVVKSGVKFPIIGTKAFDKSFRKEALNIVPGLTVSLDAKGGKIAIKGWEEKSLLSLEEAYGELRGEINRFIYTAVNKDGALSGIEEVEKFWKDEKVLYAGGVTNIEDLKKLSKGGFYGAIIGKSIYEGKLKLSKLCEEFGRSC